MANELDTVIKSINSKRKLDGLDPIDSADRWVILDHLYDEMAGHNLYARTPRQAQKHKKFLETAKSQLLEAA
jgi:hypothetical protein